MLCPSVYTEFNKLCSKKNCEDRIYYIHQPNGVNTIHMFSAGKYFQIVTQHLCVLFTFNAARQHDGPSIYYVSTKSGINPPTDTSVSNRKHFHKNQPHTSYADVSAIRATLPIEIKIFRHYWQKCIRHSFHRYQSLHSENSTGFPRNLQNYTSIKLLEVIGGQRWNES